MQSIVVFASGGGTNTRAIINYFKGSQIKVALIVCNNPNAGVLAIAESEKIPYIIVNKKTFSEALLVEQIMDYTPKLLVLAGFLWKIPTTLLQAFGNNIINIHPALLPKYGGKGMYGHHVHEAVIAAGEKESGITIHYVNEVYDAGAIILQSHCPILPGYTPNDLAHQIHKLEHFYLPRTIQFLLEAH